MATYVELGAVKTWYDEHGQGDPLALLHGGLADARFFTPNLPALAEHVHLSTPERRGHGHTPDVEGPITYQLMTDDTIAFLDTVVMISGGFNKSGEAAPDAEWNLDQLAEFLGPAYGEVSPDGMRDPAPAFPRPRET
jgi:hypothetical protein